MCWVLGAWPESLCVDSFAAKVDVTPARGVMLVHQRGFDLFAQDKDVAYFWVSEIPGQNT